MDPQQYRNATDAKPGEFVKPILDFGSAGSQKTLREHQKRVVHAYLKNVNPDLLSAQVIRSRGFLLQHSLGSGKTLTSIATAANLLQVREIGGAIFVVKLKTLVQWKQALVTLWPETSVEQPFPLENQILVTTQEQLSKALRSGGLEGGLSNRGLSGGADDDDEAQEPPNENDTTEEEVNQASAKEGYAHQEYLNALILRDALKGGPMQNKVQLSQSLVVQDEAHRLSNLTNDTFVAKQISERCKKIMLMTATPFRNHPKDASIHFSLITQEWPSEVNAAQINFGYLPIETKSFDQLFLTKIKTEDNFSQASANPTTINMYLKRVSNWVSYQNVADDPSELTHQPTAVEVDPEITTVFMTEEQYNVYSRAEKETTKEDASGNVVFKNAFLNRTRQACNSVYDAQNASMGAGLTEPKIAAIVNEIGQQLENRKRGLPTQLPIMVYSEFIQKGINRVGLRLSELYAARALDPTRILRITGRTTPAQLASIQRRVLDSTSQDVLLISGAGSEGLDTRGIRQVHILESPWNQAELNQALGRAIRQDSHAGLPLEQRRVMIFKWTVAKTPEQKFRESKPQFNPRKVPAVQDTPVALSADKQVYRTVERKNQVLGQFAEFLRCNSIERNVFRVPELQSACGNDVSLLSNPSIPVIEKEALKRFRPWSRLSTFAQRSFEAFERLPLSAEIKSRIQAETRKLLPKWSTRALGMPATMPTPSAFKRPREAEVPRTEMPPTEMPKRPVPSRSATPVPTRSETPVPPRSTTPFPPTPAPSRSATPISRPGTPSFPPISMTITTENINLSPSDRAKLAFFKLFRMLSEEDRRRAYIQQARIQHPDKGGNEEVFKALDTVQKNQGSIVWDPVSRKFNDIR